MSVKHLLRAAGLTGLSPRAKLCALALANFAGQKSGKAWPKQATLIEWTGLSPRGLRRGLRELEVAGLIEAGPLSGRGRVYTMLLPTTETEPSSELQVGHIGRSDSAIWPVRPVNLAGQVVQSGRSPKNGVERNTLETPTQNEKIRAKNGSQPVYIEHGNGTGVMNRRIGNRKNGSTKTVLRVADIAADVDPQSSSDADIIALGFRASDGVPTPAAVMKVWRRAVAKYHPGPALRVATGKELSAARNLIRQFGHRTPKLIVTAVSRWSVFVARISASGLNEGKPVATRPDIMTVLRFAQIAVDLPASKPAVQTTARRPARAAVVAPAEVVAPEPGSPGTKVTAAALAAADRLIAKFQRIGSRKPRD